ncbi:hypothetical protein OT109_18280 [Phycisphaeraceae bacterium D3-23]
MTVLLFFIVVVAALLALAGLLHAAGNYAPALARLLRQAPGLDVVVFAFLVAPPAAAMALWAGLDVYDRPGLWLLLGVAVLAQSTTLVVWSFLHEMHPKHKDTRRTIFKTLNRAVGGWRNHLAVWWTSLAAPLFILIRIAEYIVYPPLTWLIRLPKYKSADWINVSRTKFDGLVGYDLVWCLYCDWMTGVWSLGGEMLRNVESFWCPIRFSNTAKCANCKTDFPDIDGGWVDESADMPAVQTVLEDRYVENQGKPNAWFGHPARLTVEGKEPKETAS